MAGTWKRFRLRLSLMVITLAAALLALAPHHRTLPADGTDLAPNSSAHPGPAPPSVSPESDASDDPVSIESIMIGRRGTLSEALDRLAVPAELRQPLLDLVADEIDLRRLSPSTGVSVDRDAAERWRHVAIRPEPGRYLQIDVGGSGTELLDHDWIDVPVEIETRTASGTIEESVAQALAGADNGTFLTMEFAEIFQWDVDLLVDPRPGDQVRMVYELRRLGKVSPLLPPFDGAPRAEGEMLGPGRVLAASYTGRMAAASAFWVADDEGGGDYYDADGRALRKTFLKSPLNYRRISSRFSRARRNPVTRRVVPHHGVDYAADAGTPVVAAADGRIISAGWDGPLGRAIRIRHGSEHVTIYGHLRSFAKGIRRGVQVKQNEVIGYVGSTGRATGPHLHYTVLHHGKAIDPLKMENPPTGPLDPDRLPVLAACVQRWGPAIDLLPEATSAVASRGASEDSPHGAY